MTPLLRIYRMRAPPGGSTVQCDNSGMIQISQARTARQLAAVRFLFREYRAAQNALASDSDVCP